MRIVAGKWRRRWIEVGDSAAIRPTPDRVRETLFNWLQPSLPGTRWLDLYAGTGILGLEALSRGAAAGVFVEHDRDLAGKIRENLLRLDAGLAARVVAGDVRRFLGQPGEAVSLVFLDPPYADNVHGELCKLLVDNAWLADAALVYLEQQRGVSLPQLPDGFDIEKNKTAGQVRFMLARYHACRAEAPGRR